MTHSSTDRPRPQILAAAVSLLAASLMLTTVSGAAADPPAPGVPHTSAGPRAKATGLTASPLAKPSSGRGGR
jgi:hypothetical protein